jgi:hypothetical protein
MRILGGQALEPAFHPLKQAAHPAGMGYGNLPGSIID